MSGGRSAATMPGTFTFCCARRFNARACTFASPMARSPRVHTVRLLKALGGKPPRAPVVAVVLAGGIGRPATLPPLLPIPPAVSTVDTGSCFRAKFSLGGRLAGRICPGETGRSVRSPGVFTVGTGSRFRAKFLLGGWLAGRIRAGETGRLVCSPGPPGAAVAAVDPAGGLGPPGRRARPPAGKSKFTTALVPGPLLGCSRHGKDNPSGSAPHLLRPSAQITRPRSSRRTRAGILVMPNLAMSSDILIFIPTSSLASWHIESHGIPKP